MSTQNDISPAVKFFFKSLERRSDALKNAERLTEIRYKEVPIDEVEQFFRSIKGQNIFINTVGVNGKRESTILAKAIFNLNQVVRVYYSISFDDSQSGFLRIRTDVENQTIAVERIHGLRPRPELLYQSADQLKIVRYMTRWLLRRIDWDKTKLNNLELYKQFVEARREEHEAQLREQIEGVVEEIVDSKKAK
ncbi:MAG: hypothetical protein IBX48_03030 [Thiomicrospira sp.]|uniref:hypothetical protein n=1 Tax=Thiomicrospira sp. TaxID=935 RepID=UPI001A036A8C|nr:hypothetical protein [Thiomicrospira sp.]MBE0493293.1 hypothetical protein [Thiomicrospira sp.]